MSTSSSSAAMATSIDLIVFEILSRLPAKSVLRFKSVCKKWFALISEPSFLAAHTRCNPLTVFGIIIQHAAKGPICSTSIEGGPWPVLPDPWLFSPDRRFGAHGAFRIWQHCNGLLLCSDCILPLPPLCSRQFLLNPTTMQYRQIPNLPTALRRCEYQFMLAFDPSTSLQYRIVCLSRNTRQVFDPTAPRFHVEIFSSDTGAWELSRETMPGACNVRQGVYWNGALNWITTNRLVVSFDVERQVMKTTPMPPRDHRGVILYFGESRGHLHLMETVVDLASGAFDWQRFHVFEMGKNDPSWSLLYNVDLNGLRAVYPETQGAAPDKNVPTKLLDWRVREVPVFFARGGEEEDDKLYSSNPEKIFCYNLADRTRRNIFAINSHITSHVPWWPLLIEGFPFAHSLFSP